MQNKWKNFFDTRNKVFNLIEKLKQEKLIKESKEVSVTLPKNLIIEGFNMQKFLDVAEVIEGKEISVYKSNLEKCERCQRFKKKIELGFLCCRCLKVIKQEKPEKMSVESYVDSFELDSESASRMIEYLKGEE